MAYFTYLSRVETKTTMHIPDYHHICIEDEVSAFDMLEMVVWMLEVVSLVTSLAVFATSKST